MKYFLLLLLFSAVSTLSLAQSSPAASAPLGVTPNTECGAPGVGKRSSLAARGKVFPDPVGTPGLRVAVDGYWTQCRMPKPAPDCSEIVFAELARQHRWAEYKWIGAEWQRGFRGAPSGYPECVPIELKTLRAAYIGTKRSVMGMAPGGRADDPRGRKTWLCTAQGWEEVQNPSETYCR